MLEKLRYLKPIVIFVSIALLITSLSRLLLMFVYSDRVFQVPDFWQIFTIGIKMDMILISYLLVLPIMLVSLTPTKALKYFNRFLSIYFILFLFLFFVMELVTPDFLGEHDTRPNKMFIEYIIYPKEIASMIINGRPIATIVVFTLAGIGLFFGIKYGRRLFSIPESSYKLRLILLPILLFFIFWGARGSLTSKRPYNPSNAIFSNDQMVNTLGISSLYSLYYAAYSMKNEVDASKLYGKMDENEAYERVKKYMNVPEECFTDSEIPLLHIQKADSLLQRPYNLVIMLEESFGADYVGCLGGMPLSPEFDKLSKEGLLFTNLYCTGTRSVRGIEAVVTGFPPTPSESVVKLSNSQTGFFTLAQLLSKHGYDTSFIYGGGANFDNMSSFFSGNGFRSIVDEGVMDKDGNQYAFKSTWGYSDEDLMVKANQYFKSVGNKPFFSLMFSSSNHDPFDFPSGRINLYEQPQNTVFNAIKYADYAIGRFFEMAKKEEYFENTVFIIIADHNTRTYGTNLVPIHKFHIPALILAPNLKKGTYDKLCSQIDIAPTLLNIMGMEVETPMPGRNLMALPDSVPGRSIMQFHNINAFRVDNKILIMQPNKEPLQFELKNDTTYIPVSVDPELAKDALGHIVTAENMYKKRKYRLK